MHRLLNPYALSDSYNTRMKLITLNIEGPRHLDRVLPFVKKEKPDVLCLQEVFRSNMSDFESIGYSGTFLPMSKKYVKKTEDEMGIAICTQIPASTQKSFYYLSSDTSVPIFKQHDIPNSVNHGILYIEFVHEEAPYSIATTHFTWTKDGKIAGPEQIKDMELFLSHVSNMPPHIMCGDFNIPRGYNPLYEKLTNYYTDTIPLLYTSSLDKDFHYSGSNPDKKLLFDSFLVDYVFSQPSYLVSDVRLEFGLSDHAAVVATIQRT